MIQYKNPIGPDLIPIPQAKLHLNSIDLTGKRFGKLLVLSIGDQCFNKKGGKAGCKWNCLCECGRQIQVRGGLIKNQKSCGCAVSTTNTERHWQGFGEISGAYFNRIERDAKDRGLSFEIDVKIAWELFKGYILDNIQWVHKDINQMKWGFSIEKFYFLCEQILKGKEDYLKSNKISPNENNYKNNFGPRFNLKETS
jgi:hypothetical protein